MNDSLIPFLKERFKAPLPGDEVRMQMAPSQGRAMPNDKTLQSARTAAVLLLLFKKNNEWSTVFIQRVSTNPNDRHKGQISFPGGMNEEEDNGFETTALREANEEIGIVQEDVSLLGKLSVMYIPISNFVVHPYVGVLDYAPSYKLQESEVADVIEVPLSLFKSANTKQIKDIRAANGMLLKNVPYFDLKGKTLWGATAMMFNEFLHLFDDSTTDFPS